MTSKNKSDTALPTDLNEQTIEFLNLSKQPFAAEILSDKSFFNTQIMDKISDSLAHQVQFTELLLIIEGPHGSGKTALFRQFIQTDISNTKILSMQAEATDTLVQLQQKMSIHLQDMGDANHLDDNLKNLHMFDQTPLAVIDSAHVLSDTTLQELFRYQQQLKQEHEVTLKILIFANTGIAQTLQNITEIQAEQVYVQNMPEYSAQQVDAFISHKLQLASYSGEAILDSNSIQQLFKKSKGIPLAIMQFAAPMIDKAVIQKTKPASSRWKKPLALTFILLILLGAGLSAYILFPTGTTKEENTVNTQPESTTEMSTETVFTEDETPSDSLDQNPDIADTLENSQQAPADMVDDMESELPARADLIAQQAMDQISETAPEVVAQPSSEVTTDSISTNSAPVEPGYNEQGITVEEPAEPPGEPTNTPQIADTTPEPEEPLRAAPVAKTTTPTKDKAPELATNITHNITPSQAPAPTPANKPQPGFKQLESAGVRNVNWLLKQPAGNWTLQFLGASSPQALLKFAKKHPLNGNGIWYQSSLKGQPYYVLIYGSYPNRDSARKAINQLSPQLRAIKPWIKSLKAVQQALE